MNIPLDKLYNFLHGISGHNISIYRFSPHGSKNLSDLCGLIERGNFFSSMTTINMVCNDQEPLNYDLYKGAKGAPPKTWAERNWHAAIDFREQKYLGFRSVIPHSGINLNDYCFLLHSEKNSNQLKLYEQDNYIGIYYWSHAIIARDWFRYAIIDPDLKSKSCWPSTDFLIYNRAWNGSREYRVKFAELLIDHDLLQSCQTKFNPVDSQHYTLHQFTNSNFRPNRTDLELHFISNSVSSSASADYSSSDYQDTAIEVVLETIFDDSRHHLTEKILRPIACGQPFMLAATPGSLQYLRDYGFQTFAPYIDETYDTITDPVCRLQYIIAEMKRISKLSVEQKNELNSILQTISQHNKKRFFSPEFFQDVISEYQTNLKNAIEILRPLRKGKNWKAIRKFLYDSYGMRTVRELLSYDDPPNFTKEMSLRLRKWIHHPPDI